jgi:mannose-6-phosphate isomerase-like protein (cupin superfamily)
MSTTATTTADAITLNAGEGEAIWFVGALATIKSGSDSTDGVVTVVEMRAPEGMGSPLHIHHDEDEWFYVIEGEVAFLVGEERYDAKAGSFVYGPRDVQHTFLVTSPEARFLLVCEPTGFEDFVREAGVPAESLTIPGPEVPIPDPERLTAIAAKYGMDILGPPGIPD